MAMRVAGTDGSDETDQSFYREAFPCTLRVE